LKSKNASEKYPGVIKSENLFPVVGVGASAGGLDAFKALLKAIPEDSGMAYILLQHLSPDHESKLPEILQKVTKVPVLEISDELRVEPNHIYVMPSNKVMIANDGVLLLEPRDEVSRKKDLLPIDHFFKSLAEIHQEHAIGVVLSGTASDGTMGLQSIKDNGGITFAQDTESAAYSSMPNSAIDAGVVDFVLSPDKIPAKLQELTNIIAPENGLPDKVSADVESVFSQIITLLRDQKGTDFTCYKQTTTRRRILRRMAINKITSVEDYLAYLKTNTEEQDLLYDDFLIPVTSFFRNPESFKELQETFLPLIHKNKPEGETIRVWVAGCSTGEEAYSLAISFQEFFDNNASTGTEKRVQIFASDLSQSSIDKARKGIYTKLDVADVPDKLLARYFTKLNGKYQVNRHIRDLCVFAHHNFLNDPPFGKMDLVTCRNVFIYMDPYLQKKALSAFHYALNPKGFLMLGKSETINVAPGLFNPAAKRDRIYSRTDVPNNFVQVASRRSNNTYNQTSKKQASARPSDFEKIADEIMLSKYVPSGVVVNVNMEILQFRGSTKNYLEQTSGKPSHNLLTLAKPGLSFELRSILHKAKKQGEAAIKENIPVKIDGALQNISIEAIPLPDTIEPYYLVLFHEQTSAGGDKPHKPFKDSENDEKSRRIQRLEQELVEVREDMRRVTEEQEAANEELQSANEELQSSSEELQSLNEELETSTEEVQSTNQELIVVNQEMASLNKQLETERNYSQSIVANLREPLLVLDKNLRIKTANNAFYKVFKFSEGETENVLIYELGNNSWDIPDLRKLLERVIPKKTVINDYQITHTFEGLGEIIMLINARKVVTEHETEELLLLSIEDITEKVLERKKREEIQATYTKELEEKVQERTQEIKLTNEELLQKNKELVIMNKELEAFTYVSSHDLQEPLRKIQTYADLIQKREDQNISDKGKTYFSIILNSAQHMRELIDDLLAFSKLATSERKYITTNLKTVIKKVTASLQETIKEQNATIEVTGNCEADIIPFQFRQLMQNLISNALKFSKPGVPPHIVVRCRIKKGSELNFEQLAQNKEYCHISVTDNGIGFEDGYSEKIFEVFQKLHGKDNYPGTGIGLATVRKIVDNHNGLITATSEVGKGTTFDIYLPSQNHNQ